MAVLLNIETKVNDSNIFTICFSSKKSVFFLKNIFFLFFFSFEREKTTMNLIDFVYVFAEVLLKVPRKREILLT